MKAAAKHLVDVPTQSPHRYGFRGDDRLTLYCRPCGEKHRILLPDPVLRPMTLAKLRERGELEEEPA